MIKQGLHMVEEKYESWNRKWNKRLKSRS